MAFVDHATVDDFLAYKYTCIGLGRDMAGGQTAIQRCSNDEDMFDRSPNFALLLLAIVNNGMVVVVPISWTAVWPE